MKQSVNVYQFRDAFRACGRESQFSYDALGQLYDWLEEFYADADSGEYDLDVIALCCDFSEDTAPPDDAKPVNEATDVVMIGSITASVQVFATRIPLILPVGPFVLR